jgi:hypothetical protein
LVRVGVLLGGAVLVTVTVSVGVAVADGRAVFVTATVADGVNEGYGV